MKSTNKSSLDLLMNKVAINLYVFHAYMKNRVGRNVESNLIVTQKVKQLEDEELKNH